jgi:hypothetical protein
MCWTSEERGCAWIKAPADARAQKYFSNGIVNNDNHILQCPGTALAELLLSKQSENCFSENNM